MPRNAVTNMNERIKNIFRRPIVVLEILPEYKSAESIIIPRQVTHIVEGAFEGNIHLKEVYCHRNIREIGINAFKDCSSLKDIVLPKKLTNIKMGAFSYCNSLIDIIIPDSAIDMESAVFEGCTSLKSVKLPEKLKVIMNLSFDGCTSLVSVNIPEKIEEIGVCSFRNCSSLEKINIPSSVTRILNQAFEGCSSLKEITIPEKISKIEGATFSQCSALEKVNLSSELLEIGASSFEGCSSLKEITIPKYVVKIRSAAFKGCSSLTSINIPKGVTYIGGGAFEECKSLTSINIPKRVTAIENITFLGCSSLTSINIPEGVTYIGEGAFEKCSSLTEIRIPKNVKRIEKNVFYQCTNLEKVEILLDDIVVPLNAFDDCPNLKEPKLPDNREKGQIKFQKGGYVTIYEDEQGKIQVESHTYSLQELIEKGKIDSGLSKEEQEKIYRDYQKEFEKTLRIYRDMPFKYSRNINVSTAIDYVEKMRKILGDEEVESMFRLPQEVDLENVDSKILSVYEKRYSMKGSIPITVDILENLSGVVGKADRIKLFKELNGILEEGNKNIPFEELMKECANTVGIEVSEEIIGKIKGRVLQREYIRKEEDIQEAIEKEVRVSGIDHRGIVSGLIEKVIKANELSEGGIEDIEAILQAELGREKEDGSKYYGEGITNEQMQERIRAIIGKVYENNEDLIGKKISEKLSETKEQIGDRWIGKILQATSKKDLDDMTEEEYTEIISKLKEAGVDTRKIEEIVGEGKLVLKPGISKEEAMKVLVQEEYPQVLTYEKAEMMFSAMKEPYSEKFVTWFKENREEIMERPEIYTILAQVHNRFEKKILRDTAVMTRFEQGNLSVDTVIDIYKETLDKLISRPGNEELAYKAQLVEMGEEEFEEAQDIFEVTKKRERSYIPTVESESKHYRGRILRADDVMNILAGDATNCCQRVGDVGENSARHGAMENTGRIFVVEELDENGNPIKIVAQSWVWRNKDRMCFDNIEVPTSQQYVLRDGESSEDISRQEEILEIYRECAERAIAKDEKLFSRLLKEGKITQEQYEALVLKDVTVGTGYNDLGVLEQRGLERVEEEYMMRPKMSLNVSYNNQQNYGRPWIDSGVNDGWQLYLAKNETHKRVGIGKQEIEEISLEEMYKNKREVMRLKGMEIGMAIKTIKEIEGVVFRGEQQMLGEVNTHKDIAQMYGMETDSIQAYVSREKDWYMIFEEREEEIYIADLGAINGVNAQGENKATSLRQSVEVMENVYGLMLEAGEKGKSIRLNATDDTSYLNIQNMAEKGIIKIKRSSGRQWTGGSEIGMHDMEITVDTEKMKEELDKVSKYRKKLEDREDR